MRGLFRQTLSRSAQVRLSLPRSIPTLRFSQVFPGSPRFSQVPPGSPRFSQEISDFLRFCGVSGISWENLGVIFCDFVGFRGFPGRTWVIFSAILWGFRGSWENLGVIFCDFVGFPGFPGRTWVETVGDGLGRAARVSWGKSGWRVAHYFDPQFLNFCRGRCRPLWPAGLPRFKV